MARTKDGGGEHCRGTVVGRRVLWISRAGEARAELDAFVRWVTAVPKRAEEAARGGPALALLAFEHAVDAGHAGPELAVSVGDAVVRGVPTAARATLTGRAPERPGVTEAQVGGGFARALARWFDAVVVTGSAAAREVLCIGPDGAVELVTAEFERGAPLSARAALALAPHDAALVVGPGAEAGLPFANVASLDGPEDRAPSFVGRGGLGMAFVRAGLVGIVVGGDGSAGPDARADLLEELTRSPRLLTRAAEGTLELGAGRVGRDLAAEARGRAKTKHGCAGCPTPCGWVFELDAGRAVGGRFSALRAALGGAGDPMEFVARANELGLDAGAAAELVGEGGADALSGLVDSASELYARALRPRPPRAPEADVHAADLAAAIGARFGARGPEPLRSLSVFGLAADVPAQWIAPLPWTGGRDSAADAGTLARWHECFAAALDLVGFCAFSAAGLLADGVVGLDRLAAALAPVGGAWGRDVGAGRAMLAAGASHVERHRRLGGGGAPAAAGDGEFARAADAYRRASLVDFLAAGATAPPPARPVGAPVRVTVVADGFLAERLGESEADAPRRFQWTVAASTPGEALRALVAGRPALARWLVRADGAPLPAVLRNGTALRADAALGEGDRLELVLLVPGG